MNKDLFYRSCTIKRELVDEDSRSVSVIFSSENPVRRWFGEEILLHGPENVDLERLESVGSALMNHNPNVIVGSLEDVAIEDNKGKATVRFDDDEEGDKALKKVRSGSLKGISVGYRVAEFVELLEDNSWTDESTKKVYKGPGMIATKWEPIEISFTPIPADSSAQVGRELSRSLDGIKIEHKSIERKEEMDENKVKELIAEAIRGLDIMTPEDIANAVKKVVSDESKPKRTVDLDVERSLCSQAAAVSADCELEISRMVRDGKTEVECLRKITKNIADNSDSDANPSIDSGQRDTKDPWKDIDADQLADSLRNLDEFNIN